MYNRNLFPQYDFLIVFTGWGILRDEPNLTLESLPSTGFSRRYVERRQR